MPAAQDNAPPSPAGSSASDGSTESVSTAPPRTPVSSTPTVPVPIFMNFTSENTNKGVPILGPARSKTTRRVNTAERRATHNAVERQRRETLNGRFMDLAALLSNLRNIRRPSKSAIVNSSIAHLHASHRHRIIAAQQLRMLKEETEALRHEANAWRSRAGAQFIEEPMRDESFGIVLSGELEFEASDMLPGDASEDEDHLGGGGEQPFAEAAPSTQILDEYTLQRQQLAHAEMLAAQQAQLQQAAHFVQAEMLSSVPLHTIPPECLVDAPSAHYYTPAPIVASVATAAVENPAMAVRCDCAECAHPHPDIHPEFAANWAQQQMLLQQQQLLEQRRGSR